MADVENRDQKEAVIARGISAEFTRFRYDLQAIIARMSKGDKIPASVWRAHQEAIASAVMANLRKVYLQQAQTMVDTDVRQSRN